MYYEISNNNEYIILSNNRCPLDYNNSFYGYYMGLRLEPCVETGNMYRVAEWCEENCSNNWLVGKSLSAFVDETDAMAFKLRWL